MKRIIVPSLLRRRNGKAVVEAGVAEVEAAGREVGDSDAAATSSPRFDRASRGRRPRPSAYVVQFIDVDHAKDASEATVSTLTADRPEATMKACGALIQQEEDDKSHEGFESTYPDGSTEGARVGGSSAREQMRNENQIQLLEKQRQSRGNDPARRNGGRRPLPAGRLLSWYESADRGTDRYAAGIDKHFGGGGSNPEYSPKGVNEKFESMSMYENMNHCDSGKEERFRSKNRGRNDQCQEEDDGARTQQSSSLFPDDDTCTNQSGPLLQVFEDDTCTDTRTAQSSSLLGLALIDDNTRTTQATMQSGSLFSDEASESISDDVTVVTSGSTTMGSAVGNASVTPSYLFELVDDDRHHVRRKRYQLGVGQNASNLRLRKGVVRTTAPASPSSKGVSSTRRLGVTAHPPPGRRGEIPSEDSDIFAHQVSCPLPPIVEESYVDAKSAFDQVLHAFFISEDDVDRITGRVRDARLGLAGMYRDRLEEGVAGRRCSAVRCGW